MSLRTGAPTSEHPRPKPTLISSVAHPGQRALHIFVVGRADPQDHQGQALMQPGSLRKTSPGINDLALQVFLELVQDVSPAPAEGEFHEGQAEHHQLQHELRVVGRHPRLMAHREVVHQERIV